MKHLHIDKELLQATLTDYDVYTLARECIDCIDESELQEKNLYEELVDAIDSKIIYYRDKWLLIEYYSLPTNPMNITDALNAFTNEIYNCLIVVNGD